MKRIIQLDIFVPEKKKEMLPTQKTTALAVPNRVSNNSNRLNPFFGVHKEIDGTLCNCFQIE